jgi:small subunit ribosomal protein S6e
VVLELNISHPANGSQKLIEVEDERKLRHFYEYAIRISPFLVA